MVPVLTFLIFFILSTAKVLLCREKDPMMDPCYISGSLRDFAWPLASQFTFSSIRQGSNSTVAPKGVHVALTSE